MPYNGEVHLKVLDHIAPASSSPPLFNFHLQSYHQGMPDPLCSLVVFVVGLDRVSEVGGRRRRDDGVGAAAEAAR